MEFRRVLFRSVVERLVVITLAERGLGLAAQSIDLVMAHLVAAGLAGPGAISVDLALYFLDRRAVGGREPLDSVVAGPPLGVEPRVDDQPAGAERHGLEIAEPSQRIAFVDAELVGELLGIERPAFRIGVEGEQRADERQVVCIFALPDMAWDALMIGDRKSTRLNSSHSCASR